MRILEAYQDGVQYRCKEFKNRVYRAHRRIEDKSFDGRLCQDYSYAITRAYQYICWYCDGARVATVCSTTISSLADLRKRRKGDPTMFMSVCGQDYGFMLKKPTAAAMARRAARCGIPNKRQLTHTRNKFTWFQVLVVESLLLSRLYLVAHIYLLMAWCYKLSSTDRCSSG